MPAYGSLERLRMREEGREKERHRVIREKEPYREGQIDAKRQKCREKARKK